MDISSIIITSASRGLLSFLANTYTESPSSSTPPLSSRSLCMVWAAYPVASVILFAARPVGAASTMFMRRLSYILIRTLIMVVLPVPGPPVITATPCPTAFSTACLCASASCIFSSSSTFFITLSILSFAFEKSISSAVSILAEFSSV